MIEKNAIHQTCVQYCTDRIDALRVEMASLRESAASDTKSSMGDKYETSREMAQIEINKLGLQLQQMNHSLLLLKSLNPQLKCTKVEAGALLHTDKQWFYLAAPLGKIAEQGTDIMVVSSQSPVGKAMLGKVEGDTFSVNGNPFKILEIY
jgi:hypothetical protein